jgi:hypothetical protein
MMNLQSRLHIRGGKDGGVEAVDVFKLSDGIKPSKAQHHLQSFFSE